tara:strand:- start:13523 stop:13999 length:477 start_codon:yes stop_codon:yes gene_type:complete
MHCPFCTATDTKVIDSRLVGEGSQVRRRRECLECGERFNTFETVELAMPRIVKRDGKRVVFDEPKLRGGIERALEKRPVSVEAIDDAMSHIKVKLRSMGDREVETQQLGEWVMDELRNLDEVAYVRFASVYRSFQDVDAFNDEIRKLQNKTRVEIKKV